jgi:hypothetical protein
MTRAGFASVRRYEKTLSPIAPGHPRCFARSALCAPGAKLKNGYSIIPAHAFIVVRNPAREAVMGRGILLFLLGVPIPVIILIALLYR